MSIHKEGYKIILITLLVLLSANILLRYIFQGSQYVSYTIIFVSSIFFLLVIWFFRDPKREIIVDENRIICPADGKIVVIEKVVDNEYFKDERLQVSIFMSPLNVHVNYYPISGKIKYYKYYKGLYLVAWHPKSSTKNERSVIAIKNDKTEILVKQIAGAVARRIVTYCHNGENIIQGSELGFIKFGSRVDLLLPTNTKINVKLNQKVFGNKTIIGYIE